MKTDLRAKHPDYFFVKRLAEQIVRGQNRDKPAEVLLREEAKRHRERLGPDGARALANLVAMYFRWLRWTKGVPAAKRMDEASAVDGRYRRDPASFGTSDFTHSVPDWVSECVSAPTGWHRALQEKPIFWLRARPGAAAEVLAALGERECSRPFSQLPEVLRYDGARDLFRLPIFTEGRVEVQDISSHLVGLACGPKPGETWWDACAGEGGKTMHLSDLMDNKGLIWASDKAAWRLDTLRRRAARLGRFNLRTASWAGGAQLPTKTRFDGVLVDAPCSGLGTWHRDPWARWTTQPSDIEELGALQRDLLSNASAGVKPGGRLVYAVCTVTSPETSAVADSFQAAHPEFEPVAVGLPKIPRLCSDPTGTRLQIWQGPVGGNGMYIAAWRRRA